MTDCEHVWLKWEIENNLIVGEADLSTTTFTWKCECCGVTHSEETKIMEDRFIEVMQAWVRSGSRVSQLP